MLRILPVQPKSEYRVWDLLLINHLMENRLDAKDSDFREG
jgi:hypothetical protein